MAKNSAHQNILFLQDHGALLKEVNVSPIKVPCVIDGSTYAEVEQHNGAAPEIELHQDPSLAQSFLEASDVTGVLSIHYLYRDANNFKQHETLQLRGKLTAAAKAIIFTYLDDIEGFIPEDIGWEGLQDRFGDVDFDEDGDDHPYHELTYMEFAEGPLEKDQQDEIAALTKICLQQLKEK